MDMEGVLEPINYREKFAKLALYNIWNDRFWNLLQNEKWYADSDSGYYGGNSLKVNRK